MIRVVVARPHQKAEVVEIEDTLEAMQAVVGGFVEELPRWADIHGAKVYVNEEGRLDALPPNREWPKGSELVGTMLISKPGADGDLVSLTVEEAEAIVATLERCKTGN